MRYSMRFGASLVLAALSLAGCARTRAPASLVQARALHDSLQNAGAEQRVEANMLRAREAIARADSAVTQKRSQDYVNQEAYIALRTVQTAEARDALLRAQRQVDSLRTARLERLLTLSQAQRNELARRNQLSQAEIAALRERNLLVAESADSLRQEVAAGEVQTDSLRQQTQLEQARSDSLRQVAELAAQQADSLRRLAEEASREQTAAEQQQTDSLRRVAETAMREADSLRSAQGATAQALATGNPQTDSLQRVAQRAAEEADSLRDAAAQESREQTAAERQRADSLRQVAEQATRQLDSLRTVAEASTRVVDSLRTAVETSSRERDSLRAEVEAANQRLTASLSELRTTVTELRTVRETERGVVLGLSGVLFDVGQSDLKPGAERNLQRIAEILQQYPNYQLSVEGHTDSTGSQELNRRLSTERAAAVKQALVAGGLDESRIAAQGFGPSQPVATNATRAGRQANRRVEIVVLGAGSGAPPQ